MRLQCAPDEDANQNGVARRAAASVAAVAPQTADPDRVRAALPAPATSGVDWLLVRDGKGEVIACVGADRASTVTALRAVPGPGTGPMGLSADQVVGPTGARVVTAATAAMAAMAPVSSTQTMTPRQAVAAVAAVAAMGAMGAMAAMAVTAARPAPAAP